MDMGPMSLHLLALLLEPNLGQQLPSREAGKRLSPSLGNMSRQVGPRVDLQPVAAEHQGIGVGGAVALSSLANAGDDAPFEGSVTGRALPSRSPPVLTGYRPLAELFR
jgi:hypothetical protein